MNGTYVECLSNYCLDIYPNNESSSFRNLLAREIDTTGYSSVALMELSFLYDFPLQDKDATFMVFDFLHHEGEYWGKFSDFSLDQKVISNAFDLISEINEKILTAVPRLKLKKREIFSVGENKKIWMKFEEDDYISVIFRDTTLILIGAQKTVDPDDAIAVGRSKDKKYYVVDKVKRYFPPGEEYQVEWKSGCEHTDFFVHQPKLGQIDQFLVFSDIVKETNVAGNLANLLRYVTIPSATDSGNRITISYGSNAIYRPLAETQIIREIKILLKGPNDQFLPLKGPVRACLNIK